MQNTGATAPHPLGDIASGSFVGSRNGSVPAAEIHGLTVPQDEGKEFNEKALPAKGHQSDDGEDEDINALIEDLESDDEGADIEEEEEVAAGAARNIPEELLMTSASIGLTTEEVLARRKKFGLNQMKGM